VSIQRKPPNATQTHWSKLRRFRLVCISFSTFTACFVIVRPRCWRKLAVLVLVNASLCYVFVDVIFMMSLSDNCIQSVCSGDERFPNRNMYTGLGDLYQCSFSLSTCLTLASSSVSVSKRRSVMRWFDYYCLAVNLPPLMSRNRAWLCNRLTNRRKNQVQGRLAPSASTFLCRYESLTTTHFSCKNFDGGHILQCLDEARQRARLYSCR